MDACFEDPVRLEIMRDAVVTSCGHSFSAETLTEWLAKQPSCPVCKHVLTTADVKPNYALREAIQQYLTASPPVSQAALVPLRGVAKELHPDHQESASDVLERAFRSDAYIKYIFSSGAAWVIPACLWLLQCIVNYGVQYGRVWGYYTSSSSELQGVAVWQPPFFHGISFWNMMKVGMLNMPLKMGLKATFRFMGVVDAIERKHQETISNTPHWSLYHVGVLPEQQGQGIGTCLLQPIMEAADKEGVPCYLDTPSERSLRFFERLGFRVVFRVEERGLPVFWTLLRDPQKPLAPLEEEPAID